MSGRSIPWRLVAVSAVAASLCSSVAGASALALRAGMLARGEAGHLRHYEVALGYEMPWVWRWPSGPSLVTSLDVSAGTLRGGGDEGVVAAVGPSLALADARTRLSPNFGVRAALLGDHEIARHEFGGPIQFLSHVGIGFQLDPRFGAGYRYQYLGAGRPNHKSATVDLHVIELTYRF